MTVAAARALEPPLQRLARAGFLSLGASVAIQGLNVVSGVILARGLGPAGRGELAAVLLWPGVLAGVGGLSAAEGAAYVTARGDSPVRATTASALTIGLAQALVLVAIGCVMIPLALGHYGTGAVVAGRLYLALLPPYLVAQAAMAILQGRQRWLTLNLLRIAATTPTVAGLIVLMAAHRLTVLNVTWLYVLVGWLALGLTLSVILARGWLGARPDIRLMRSILTFGLKAHVGSLAGQANLNLDRMAIATFLAPRDLGVYSVGVTLSAPLTMIGSSIGVIALPAVAASDSALERRQHFAWLMRSTLALSAATALTLVLLAPVLTRLFFGAEFLPAVVIAQVAIAAALVRGMGYVLAYGLCAFNRPLAQSVAEVIGVLTTAAGLVILLPTLGLVGAAVTSLLAYSSSAAYMVWFAHRRLEIGLVELLVPKPADAVQWVRCLRR
jgi:O-antigen/teichoic acid export membrane protein